MNKENERFAEFLNSDYCSRIMHENKLTIQIETGNLYYDNLNTNESIYNLILGQQDTSKKLLDANFSFGGDFPHCIKKYLPGIDSHDDDK